MHGLGRWLHVNKPPSQLALRPATMATVACSLEAGEQAKPLGSNRTGCTHSAPHSNRTGCTHGAPTASATPASKAAW